MIFSLPQRRLLPPANSLLHAPSSLALRPHLHSQNRSLNLNPFKRRKPPSVVDRAKLEATSKTEKPPNRKPGDLAPGSIFDSPSPSPSTPSLTPTRDPHSMAAALDPLPASHRRWQRKKLIQSIRSRSRLSPTTKLLRTERSSLLKSPLIKTSVKKLYPLARQIAGKPLGEAMVQMRFSRKKAAGEVLGVLREARDRAVVVRGMGLGGGEGEGDRDGEGRVVVDKKGKRRVVSDPSSMYVDEAWVGRGRYEFGRDYRARGQSNRLMLPYTSISVVLKEEKTRIRLMEEREAKRAKKRVWVPLPDRKVTAQRQFQLW